jgi:hypothetical protein
MKCVLCHEEDAEGVSIARRDAYRIVCPRCGTYDVSGRALAVLPGSDPDIRLKLTWATRQASELGAPLAIFAENFEEFARSVVEPQPPPRKLDQLVLLVGERSPSLGGEVHLHLFNDWPLVYAKGTTELQGIIHMLEKETPYLFVREVSPKVRGVRLTKQGWERFAQLETERPKSTAAFVAMPFASEMKPPYDEGFHPALYDLGYDPIRVDREEYLGKIDDFIVASIRKSALLVADFTGMRTGVFFEVGFGLGLGIHVVWTCREDWLPKLGEHFDTRQFNHLPWKDPADLKARLRTRIEAAVIGRPRPRS